MQEYIGAIKIKDGLFLGDIHSAQDLEFVVNNKINYIINCAGRQIPNHWEPIGIKYLTFNWTDGSNQVILDQANMNFSQFYSFIEEGLSKFSGVLVHCVRGGGRSILVIVSYLMKRFSWSLYKVLQFLDFRRVNIDIPSYYLLQARSFEQFLIKKKQIVKTNQWSHNSADPDEQLMRNTFINTYLVEEAKDFKEEKPAIGKRISWADESADKIISNFPKLKGCLKQSPRSDAVFFNYTTPAKSASLNQLKPKKKKIENKIEDKSMLFQRIQLATQDFRTSAVLKSSRRSEPPPKTKKRFKNKK